MSLLAGTASKNMFVRVCKTTNFEIFIVKENLPFEMISPRRRSLRWLPKGVRHYLKMPFEN
jgi:hypothetical protein